MKLAAIYINQHEFLFDKPQTINFGGKYIYSFTKTEKELYLERKLNDNFIENFWNKSISNVSAIVGANGSGKTKICEELFNQLHLATIDYYKKIDEIYFLFLFEDGEDIKLIFKYYYLQNSDDFDKSTQENFEIPKGINNRMSTNLFKDYKFRNSKIDINFRDFNKDISFITPYYFNLVNHFHQKINISNQIEALHNLAFLSNELLISKVEESFGQINFIKNYKIELNESLYNFKSIENFIYVNINPKERISDKDFDDFLESKDFKPEKHFFYYLNTIFNEQNNETGIYDLNGMVFYNKKKTADKMFDYNCQLIARFFYKAVIENYSIYETLCERLMSKINYESLKTKNNFLKILNSISSIVKNEKEIFNYVEKIIRLVELTPEDFILHLSAKNYEKNKNIIETYTEVSKKVSLPVIVPTNLFEDQDIIKTNFLTLKAGNGISYGERNLIKLFSSIYNNRDNIHNLLILDEPEIGFHPLWKKKFVKAVTSIVPIILDKNENDKVQIIFTTHDPLTLSDLPNSNVVYLKKDKQTGFTEVLNENNKPQKSFGANITDLLADSFFIEDGLIGDFAKGKIEDVIKWLKDDNRDNDKKENTLKIISMIDEPLMNIKLKEMYYSVFKDDRKLDDEKEFIRRRAIELGLLKEEND